MQEVRIRMVINHLINQYEQLDEYRLELEARMEELDMESKDYAELDFEYNWTNGHLAGLKYAIELLEEKE